MKYSIQHNGQDTAIIKVLVPSAMVGVFLAFIDQKAKESTPIISKSQSLEDENYLRNINTKLFDIFDYYVSKGFTDKSALSQSLREAKALGFNNITYDYARSILIKSGRFKMKKPS